jgi:hypothetical protein
MAEEKVKRHGCPCGWPLDSCNPNFAKGKSCGKDQNDRESERLRCKDGLEAKARDHDVSAAFYRRSANFIQINEEE